MATLSKFFRKPSYEQALDRYERVARGRGWGVGHKLEMYNYAKATFDPALLDLSEAERRREFGAIYDHLRGGWRVFRGTPAGSYWTATQTYDALTGDRCRALCRQGGHTLLTLRPDTPESEAVLAGLASLRDLKQTRWYPWMPVSKFTHFLNPMLFPIYDTEVIWKQVLDGAFQKDYRLWCQRIGVAPLETDTESARFNLTYTLLAGDILRGADEDFMGYFARCFWEQVDPREDEHGVLGDVHRYYATAFEFVAIGAASL